jgi:hypothetical protein
LTASVLRWLVNDAIEVGMISAQRRPGAKGHPQLVRHTKHNEDLIEDGNHNGPSSDAEHAREETGQAAGGPQYYRQKNQMAHDPESASLNIAVSIAGMRVRDRMASTICGTPVAAARTLASQSRSRADAVRGKS